MKLNTRLIIGSFLTGLVLVGALLFFMMKVERIPSGHVGVVYSLEGVEDDTLGTGWHVIGWFDKVIEYPTRMQTVEYKDIQVATSDGKSLTMDFAYTFNVDPSEAVSLFNKFGPVKVDDIASSYLRTRLWDAGRKAVSKYDVIGVYGEKSSEATTATKELFAEDVGKLGFIVDNLTLGVPKPDASTQKAIDERVKATQELQRKATEILIADAEAERRDIEAESIKSSNKKINDSMTPEIISYMWVKKWNGVAPISTGGNNLMQLPMPVGK